MPKQIQVDNQIIEFPDDMPDNEIEAVIKKEFYSQPQQPTPQEQTQQQPKMSRLQAFSTTSSNIPFAPRIKAGISALTAKAIGGDETIGAFYDEALGNELNKLKQARREYPVQSFASQLATDISGGGAILKGLGLAGTTVKQALAGGAAIGGLSAAGETEADLASSQGLADIGAGSLYGAGGGVVGQQAGKLIGKSVPFVKGVAQRLKGSTPESIISKVITPEEAGQQARKLSSRIQQGRITALPELGDENILGLIPELGNENILGLTRILGKTQGSNKIITSYINNKTATSAKRVGDLLNNNLSAESFFDNLDNLILKRQSLSAPIRQKAYEEGKNIPKLFEYSPSSTTTAKSEIIPSLTLRIDPLTGKEIKIPEKIGKTTTTGKKFIQKQAINEYGGKFLSLKDRNIALEFDNLVEDPKIKQYVNASIKDNEIQAPINSVEMLHDVRKQIDRDINGLYNAIQSKQASFNSASSTQSELSALNSLKKRLNNVIYKVSPSMKDHDKIYADSFALERSQKEGFNFRKYRNAEEVKRALTKLSDGEKEAYKIGVKDYLMDKVSKSSERNPSRAIFGNQLEYGKLKTLFSNPKEFNDFAKRLTDEIRIFDVKQRIVGGSRTDFNLAESDQLLDKIAKGALNLKTFGLADVAMVAKDAIKRKYYGLNEKTAKELAGIMISPEKSVQTLNNIVKQAQTAQERGLIQKFTEDLSKRNFTKTIAPSMGRAMATEQINNEGEQNGI